MKIIVITGPTGVGKTLLSIKLADKLNAEIINADAMQVYKGLDIGTAKISPKEMNDIPHHLFDICDVTDNYSVYNYQKDARNKIKEIFARGKNVIMVGGTGLYIKASLFDYTFSNENKDKDYSNLSDSELVSNLLSLDPDIKIDLNNRRRVLRALNYYENNNESISLNNRGDNLLYDTIFIGLTLERDKLYELIDKRVSKMINDGLILEAKKYYDNKVYSHALMTGIGYKELYKYFDREISKEDAISLIMKNSRHYAKRQYTFFRNKLPIKWFNVDLNNFDNTVNEVYEYIKEASSF